MRIDRALAAKRLCEADDILLLTHANPDGDTLGSAFALAHALYAMGKRVNLCCPDSFNGNYDFMRQGLTFAEFTAGLTVTVDIAAEKLLGNLEGEYAGKIDLCIDHHGSNTDYAKESYVEADAAAAAEVVYRLLVCMGSPITPAIADCLYVGIATDTGCFRFASTTAHSHAIAAALIEAGARIEELNRVFFETKTPACVKLESLALESLELHFGGLCATMFLTQAMLRESACLDADTDSISGIPRQIAGVLIGITFKEQPDGGYRISIRTHQPIDASEIGRCFGGGGHPRAAGCAINEARESCLTALLQAAQATLKQAQLL